MRISKQAKSVRSKQERWGSWRVDEKKGLGMLGGRGREDAPAGAGPGVGSPGRGPARAPSGGRGPGRVGVDGGEAPPRRRNCRTPEGAPAGAWGAARRRPATRPEEDGRRKHPAPRSAAVAGHQRAAQRGGRCRGCRAIHPPPRFARPADGTERRPYPASPQTSFAY